MNTMVLCAVHLCKYDLRGRSCYINVVGSETLLIFVIMKDGYLEHNCEAQNPATTSFLKMLQISLHTTVEPCPQLNHRPRLVKPASLWE
jgi:hypothetical protein